MVNLLQIFINVFLDPHPPSFYKLFFLLEKLVFVVFTIYSLCVSLFEYVLYLI